MVFHHVTEVSFADTMNSAYEDHRDTLKITSSLLFFSGMTSMQFNHRRGVLRLRFRVPEMILF